MKDDIDNFPYYLYWRTIPIRINMPSKQADITKVEFNMIGYHANDFANDRKSGFHKFISAN